MKVIFILTSIIVQVLSQTEFYLKKANHLFHAVPHKALTTYLHCICVYTMSVSKRVIYVVMYCDVHTMTNYQDTISVAPHIRYNTEAFT